MKNVIIIISLLFLNKKISALTFNNDSLKNKYELNDPRNPNCPCHKYQKLADEEFKLRQTHQTKLNKDFGEQKTNSIQTSKGLVSAGSATGNGVKTKHFKNLMVLHHKNKSFRIFNLNRGPRGKKRHFVRTNERISSCFRWK